MCNKKLEVWLQFPSCDVVQQACMLGSMCRTVLKNNHGQGTPGPVEVPTFPEVHSRSSCASAGITSQHRKGGLNNRHISSHSSGGWKFKIKVTLGLGNYSSIIFDVLTLSFHLDILSYSVSQPHSCIQTWSIHCIKEGSSHGAAEPKGPVLSFCL